MTYTAVETKFLPPTNTMGARIKATALTRNLGTGKKPSETFTFQYDDTDTFTQHYEAACYLIRRHVLPYRIVNGKFWIDYAAALELRVSVGETERGYVFTITGVVDTEVMERNFRGIMAKQRGLDEKFEATRQAAYESLFGTV